MSIPLTFKMGTETWKFFAGENVVRVEVRNGSMISPLFTLEGTPAAMRVIRDAFTKAIVIAEVAASLTEAP